MTVGNIGGGLAAIFVAMEGMSHATPENGSTWLFWSSICILFAWVFDAFDGAVARALGQMNKFGAEFDNVADLIAYSVAPSFVVYFAYSKVLILPGLESLPAIQKAIAICVGALPATFGCIRFARFNVRRLEVPGYFIGFPRPASALLMVALLNSHLMAISPTMRWVGIAMVLFLAYMNLTLVPFISHHGKAISTHLAYILHCVWMTVAFSFLLGILVPFVVRLAGYETKPLVPPNLIFDWVLVWLAFYVSVGWTEIPTATMKKVAAVTSDWNRE